MAEAGRRGRPRPALVVVQLASHDFTRAFSVGAVRGAVSVAIAAVLVPTVRNAAADAA